MLSSYGQTDRFKRPRSGRGETRGGRDLDGTVGVSETLVDEPLVDYPSAASKQRIMIVDHRTYTIRPSGVLGWPSLYYEKGWPSTEMPG